MQFAFYWFDNQEMVNASPSFKREAKRFLTPLFEKTVYNYFDKTLLCLQVEGLPSIQADNKTLIWDEVKIKLGSISGLLFTCQLSYRNNQGLVIQPYDIVEKRSLEFEIMHFPDQEQLLSIQNSWSEVIKDITTSRLINRKFRFPVQEETTCTPPDVNLRIKTSAEGSVLEDLLSVSMNEWNEENTQAVTNGTGLIHNLWFDEAIQDEKIVVIDLGSSSGAGLLHLLQALERSDLVISKIILE